MYKTLYYSNVQLKNYSFFEKYKVYICLMKTTKKKKNVKNVIRVVYL